LTADSLFDDLDEAEVLLTRMNGTHATGLIVAGRVVMQDGRLTNVDFEAARRALLEQARADLPRLRAERPRANALAEAARRYYAQW